jgi:hypothetical protein
MKGDEMAKRKPGSRKPEKKLASELAGERIDANQDRSASDREKATRKQELIEGPEEFRKIREDQRKP